LFKEKGSKFIAYAFPVTNEAEARAHVEMLKKEHHGARHHCWAYRLGSRGETTKCHDDGEPANSAGKPILGQLVSRNVTNVAVVVVRYFGGTLLGVGGLMHAYKESTADALLNAHVVEAVVEVRVEAVFAYEQTSLVMKVAKEEGARVVEQRFDMESVVVLYVRESNQHRLNDKLLHIKGLRIS
jgi:uncharacterized YigZ family protein